MLTASISVLDIAAKYRRDLLYNRYQAGRDIIAQYTEGPPYGYFIPQNQRDPVAAVEMLRRLAYNGIEVHQLDEAVTHDGIAHAAGTWVIAMDQPFANFVRQLFAVQQYPDLRQYPEGPPDQPYDVSGWTLPYMMDVRVIEAASPLGDEVRRAMTPLGDDGGAGDAMVAWDAEVDDASPFDSPHGVGFDSNPVAAAIVPPPGSDAGGGALYIDAAQNNAFKALNRAWSQGGQVRFVPGTASDDGAAGTSGHYVVTGLSSSARGALVSSLHLRAATRGNSDGVRLAQPRIGLYRPWSASMDEGWTRWLLERYDFDFASLYNPDILAGNLRDRYDVIIIADMGAGTILNGYAKGSVPPRYEGGIGGMGVRELDAFVRGGGTLVALNNASMFAISQFHLPVRNVTTDLESADYFMSGSIVEMEVDPSHPVMSGMPARAKVVVERSPVFTTEEGFEGAVLAKYSEDGSPLLSGYLLGEEHLQGYAAALDVAHGEGRVVLLGMKPQWRGQPFGNFRILFNATLYSRGMATGAPSNPSFWEAPEEDENEEGREGNAGRSGD